MVVDTPPPIISRLQTPLVVGVSVSRATVPWTWGKKRVAAKEPGPGFRTEPIRCPMCKDEDLGAVYRHERLVFWCHNCFHAFTIFRDIETVEDKQERI